MNAKQRARAIAADRIRRRTKREGAAQSVERAYRTGFSRGSDKGSFAPAEILRGEFMAEALATLRREWARSVADRAEGSAPHGIVCEVAEALWDMMQHRGYQGREVAKLYLQQRLDRDSAEIALSFPAVTVCREVSRLEMRMDRYFGSTA